MAESLGQLLRRKFDEQHGTNTARDHANQFDEYADTDADIHERCSRACAEARQSHRAMVANQKIHPRDRSGDGSCDGFTMIVCTHAYHGVEIFYLAIMDYTEMFMPLTSNLWCNGYTITVQPMN